MFYEYQISKKTDVIKSLQKLLLRMFYNTQPGYKILGNNIDTKLQMLTYFAHFRALIKN
jgi:hypothetical protein